MPIFTARTMVGREKTAIDAIIMRVKPGEGIKAILSPGEIKGYIFVEGDSLEAVKSLLRDIPNVRGVLPKEIPISDLERFFEEKKEEIEIKEGDLVEVIGGPFKREQARVKSINPQRREAKIELVDAVVPIPITLKLDLLKKIRDAEEE